jgi:uncharacterized protein YutD
MKYSFVFGKVTGNQIFLKIFIVSRVGYMFSASLIDKMSYIITHFCNYGRFSHKQRGIRTFSQGRKTAADSYHVMYKHLSAFLAMQHTVNGI